MSETDRGPAALLLLARLDSRRLPGKGLMDLGGRPVLGRAVDRLRRCGIVNDMILATSDRAIDDPLEAFAEAEGIGCYRGDAHDVAKRCTDACTDNGLDWFIRICGDSPFADPAVVDSVARRFLDAGVDLATNVYPRSFPIGASAEAVSRAAMERILAATDDLAYREHVTLYAYEHPADFTIDSVLPADPGYEDLSIAVDTPEDLDRARRLIALLPDPKTATLEEILKLQPQAA
ncbi:NTP transferase domain-containing protein [Rhodospirillaceae bacterium KN72]|uniref:NTP transferase domain-containing protein n=1 Tax=Pacificispira spongiicola TaxID=2729598 RepID=A0A7Y0HHW7_9PROT|nr:NTP transferase domain-containing protein [Pacificispira spongiicola]NMM46327.1 NTP transferase domain-containing protein [Pacificispira spongiicola]